MRRFRSCGSQSFSKFVDLHGDECYIGWPMAGLQAALCNYASLIHRSIKAHHAPQAAQVFP